VDLTVAGTVPVGSYSFAITNDAGTTDSGNVTVSVTTSLLGDVPTVTLPFSVHLRATIPGAPPGNSMRAGRSAYIPAPLVGAGNAEHLARVQRALAGCDGAPAGTP
jgi:hypothetical protein